MVKIATDISQSKKLADILPIESADMHYNNASIKGVNYVDEHRAELMEYNRAIKVLSKYTINPLFEVIPCWSLAALLSVLHEIQGGRPVIALDDNYITYPHISELHVKADNLVDACVEMIIKLKEEGLL